MESRFVPAGPIYLQVLIHYRDALSRSFLRIVRRSSIHRLQLGFVNVFIAPIGFSCFTNLNVMYLRKSVRGVLVLKCCSKWAANKSDFCPFLS